MLWVFRTGFLLTALVGCGGSTRPVAGTVTLDGQAVDVGEIEFRPIDGTPGPTTGGPIRDGRYEIAADDRGLRPDGRYRVSVSSMGPSGRMIANPAAPGGKAPELKEKVPVQYNSASTLTVTIPANGGGGVDFALTTK